MSTPGFQAQQATQRATQGSVQAGLSATRGAQQSAARGAALGMRPGRSGYAPARTGMGIVGRAIGTVLSLLIVGFAIGAFLMIMNRMDPAWFDHAVVWVRGLF
jgi:hypothetical protein